MAADANSNDPLFQLLIDNGTLTSAQVADIREEQERTGNAIRKIILDWGILREDELLAVIGNHLGTTIVNLKERDIPLPVLQVIPASVARMYTVIPVAAQANSITLATAQLPTPEIADELRFVLTRDVSFVMAREEDIKMLIARFYSNDDASINDMLTALEEEFEEGAVLQLKEVKDEDISGLAELANAPPVVKFVNLILYEAVQAKASDVHFEPFEKDFNVRQRVDGALYSMKPPPRSLATAVISRIKVMAGMNIAERRLPQDERIMMNLLGRPIDFRVSTLPTLYGESVVLRILDRSTVSLEMENLGMPDDIYNAFVQDVAKPQGIIIVTGPTGSGKTTTLYSALRRINSVDMKILTCEDPVEYDIEGLVQVQVNEAVGVSFATTLRHFVRQDPDVIMIGEIRDPETAQMAIQSSLTGHLVLTTLHTNEASGAITRLIDMNVEPFLISSTLECVLAQRLVRKVCTRCRAEYTPDQTTLDLLNLTEESLAGRHFYYGKGCHDCHDTGYHGRKGLYEYMPIKSVIRDMITQRRPTLEIHNKAVELGMRLLRDDGLRNILDGNTTVDEVLRYT